MDDERIEKQLRESWRPEMPLGMRERVLNAARQAENAPRRVFVFGLPRWQAAFAAAGLVVVVATSICNNATGARLAAVIDGSSTIRRAPASGDWLKSRRQLQELLAQVPGDHNAQAARDGDDSL